MSGSNHETSRLGDRQMSPQFRNEPQMRDEQGQNTIKRYVHSPLKISHNDIQVSIQANGKVVLSKVVRQMGDEVEVDEIEVPASLIFKVAGLLKATRTVQYLTVSEQEAPSQAQNTVKS